MRCIYCRVLFPGEAVSQPLALKSSGYNSAEKGWVEVCDGRQRSHVGIFWCVEGEAAVEINGIPHTMRKNELLYYFKYNSHRIQVTGDIFSYYWVTFDGTLCEEMLKASVCSDGVISAGGAPAGLFNAIFENLHDFSPDSIDRSGELVYRLLTLIGKRQREKNCGENCQPRHENLICERFTELVLKRYMEDSLNISSIARILGIHRTTLVRLVRKRFKLTPMTYLNTVRRQAALRLLYSSELTIKEIAVRCGISDPCYFSRQIRKLTGKSPREFRNHPMIWED